MRRTYLPALSLLLICATLFAPVDAFGAKAKKKAKGASATQASTQEASPFPSATPQAVVDVTGKIVLATFSGVCWNGT